MEIFAGASLIAAFLAGMAALFAPCCITVLLPSYFGSIFRTRRKVFLMTFIFFLGILFVFLPLGLGISAVGQIFSRFHRSIFSIVGVFFLFLGAMLMIGKKMSLPMKIHPKLGKLNAGSVFLLGIFSGIATSCCAPVLAGVMALSILPGSMIWGVIYAMAYVLGMVLPLFLLAFFLDKTALTEKFMEKTRPMQFVLARKTIRITIPELISGVTFFVMGILTLIFAFTRDVSSHSQLQIGINIYMAKLQIWLNGFIGGFPQYVWAIAIVALFLYLVFLAIKQLKKD